MTKNIADLTSSSLLLALTREFEHDVQEVASSVRQAHIMSKSLLLDSSKETESILRGSIEWLGRRQSYYMYLLGLWKAKTEEEKGR